MAKVIWKEMNRNSGIPGRRLLAVCRVMPFRNRASKPPI